MFLRPAEADGGYPERNRFQPCTGCASGMNTYQIMPTVPRCFQILGFLAMSNHHL